MGKIVHQGSVKGISAMTMVMYAIAYTCRQVLMLPSGPITQLRFVNQWTTELLQVPSTMLVFNVLWSIFVTYRSSYQSDLDVLRIKYLLPGCVLFAIPVHPILRKSYVYNYTWT